MLNIIFYIHILFNINCENGKTVYNLQILNKILKTIHNDMIILTY